MGGKTRINAIQLVLQQCCKTLTPAPAPAPAAKNLNVTKFFATKQQVSPALSLNLMVLTLGIQLGFWRKNTDTTGTNVVGTARCDFAKILAAEAQKKIERRLH